MSVNLIVSYRKFVNGRYGFLSDIFLFVIITYGFHLLFRYFASEINTVPAIKESGDWLADHVYSISSWINQNILGLHFTKAPENIMWFDNTYGISVNNSCSGLKQFYQVIVLFVLFPGPWKQKAWFIPLSLGIMFVTNIFRILALSVIQSWKPEYFEFSHDWILRPFFYVVLFGLWIWWVERVGKRGEVRSER